MRCRPRCTSLLRNRNLERADPPYFSHFVVLTMGSTSVDWCQAVGQVQHLSTRSAIALMSIVALSQRRAPIAFVVEEAILTGVKVDQGQSRRNGSQVVH